MPPPIAPEVVIAPPAAKAPTHSLLRVGADLLNFDGDSTAIRAELGDRWQAGVEFLAESCDNGALFIPCCSTEVPEAVSPPTVVYIPGIAMATWSCSSWSRKALDFKGRARRKLEAVSSHHLATEFWRGDQAIACDLPNNYLANSESVTILNDGATSTPLVYALGMLQDAISDCNTGSPGVIHAKRSLLNLWKSAHLVRSQKDPDGTMRFFDVFDNEFISDSGYDGSGPDGTIDETGDTQWAYATGVVGVAAGEITINPEKESQALDRATNSLSYTAQQVVAAAWDSCCHFGINVSVCSTCCVSPLIADDTPGG